MKNWIKKILGITKLEEDRDSFKNQVANLNRVITDLKSVIHVGADIHLHNPRESWAVVCIKGKPEYVKFVDLGNREARDIQRFLSQFDRKNVVLDLPRFVDRRRFL